MTSPLFHDSISVNCINYCCKGLYYFSNNHSTWFLGRPRLPEVANYDLSGETDETDPLHCLDAVRNGSYSRMGKMPNERVWPLA